MENTEMYLIFVYDVSWKQFKINVKTKKIKTFGFYFKTLF